MAREGQRGGGRYGAAKAGAVGTGGFAMSSGSNMHGAIGVDGASEQDGRWRGKALSLPEALGSMYGGSPTPIIRLGRGNGHGHQRQKHFRSKRVLRPIASERRAQHPGQTVWGVHHTYLLLERALVAMRHQHSPRRDGNTGQF